jgi:hypothetical protein
MIHATTLPARSAPPSAINIQPEPCRYRVHWHNNANGTQGHSPLMGKIIADRWAQGCDGQSESFKIWVEKDMEATETP